MSAADQATSGRPGREDHPGQFAICGIGLRLPGNIRHTDDFWDLLVSGRDARAPIPSSRFNVTGFDDSLGAKDTNASIPQKHGYFLEDDLLNFDASLFSIGKEELGHCDPQQRLLLEVVHECLEDAGETAFRGSDTGCYVGTFGDDWSQLNSRESQQPNAIYAVTGTSDIFLANRISYEFELHGPSMVIKTACSSSLVALHTACSALASGDASATIVGGTSLLLSPGNFAFLNSAGFLSPDSSCKTFDAKANGYARAEGIAAIYVKRLDDALRDGNAIRAVIRSTGTNSDGRTRGMTVPNGEAQERLMKKTYRKANLDPKDTAYVECHGTGTPVGDPIEATAVANVFGSSSEVLIGCVKPALGHGEAVAGLTSVIKAVLCLENDTIPPNIKFEKPNPKIPFQKKGIRVPLRPMRIPAGKQKRISVNSFGVGGSNAHVVIDAFNSHQHFTNGYHESSPQHRLLLLSAETELALKAQTQTLRDWAAKNPLLCADLAYTRALHRNTMTHKAFALLQDGNIAEEFSVLKGSRSVAPQIVMVFTGQGAQWAGMGRELIHRYSRFRQDLEAMEATLNTLSYPPEWSLMGELLKSEETSQLQSAEIAQPLCTALQVAIFRHLQRLGVKPVAVIGHSSGEIAAAYAAGRLSFEAAISVAYYRGLCTKRAPKNGGMAAVALGPKDILPCLPSSDVTIACENSPEITTISGSLPQVKAALANITKKWPGTFAKALSVSMAYHSEHMMAVADHYEDLMAADRARVAPKVPSPTAPKFMSTVFTEEVDTLPAGYWVQNLVSPVLFSGGLTQLLSGMNESAVLLEVGPHAALGGPIRQICAHMGRSCTYISTQRRKTDCDIAFLSAIGKLYQEGASIDFQKLFTVGRAIPGLPTYPWDYSRLQKLQESRVSKFFRDRQYPHHCLLGVRTEESTGSAVRWRNILHLDNVDWLKHHKVSGNIVLPFAGYVSMAGEAIRQLADQEQGAGYHCRDVHAGVALILDESHVRSVELVTTLVKKSSDSAEDDGRYSFMIESHNGTSWTQHCTGEVRQTLPPASDELPDVSSDNLPGRLSAAQFYSSLKNIGLEYSGSFSALDRISFSTQKQLSEAKMPNLAPAGGAKPLFTMHPATIDACLQLYLCSEKKGLMRDVSICVPAVIDDIIVWPHEQTGELSVIAEIDTDEAGEERSAVTATEAGKTLATMKGIHLKLLSEGGKKSSYTQGAHAAASVAWLPDFDLMDITRLIRPPPSDRKKTRILQELTFLCILETRAAVDGLKPVASHFDKYRDWLMLEIEKGRSGTIPLVSSPGRLLAMPSDERHKLMDAHQAALLGTPASAAAIGMRRLARSAKEIFVGEAEALEILTEDKVLTEIYNASAFDYGDFVRCLSHTRPTLRILEVGAGTGGTSQLIFNGMSADGFTGQSSLPLFDLYTFTDISAGFFPDAKTRFANVKNIEYKVFDISKTPQEQGFEDSRMESYDLIVATQVIHATHNIGDALKNIRPLLKHDGILLITEPDPQSLSTSYISGHLPGWWLGEEKYRHNGPLISVERWDTTLKDSGFAGAPNPIFDDSPPYHRGFAIVARTAEFPSQPVRGSISLLDAPNTNPSEDGGIGRSLARVGWKLDPLELTFPPVAPADRVILHVTTPSFQGTTHSFDEASFKSLKSFLRSITPQHKILWVFPRTQVKCTDPSGAFYLGVARGLRSEMALQLFTLEINADEPNYAEVIDKVLVKVQSAEGSAQLASDMEFVYCDGELCVGRYHPLPIHDAPSQPTESPTHESATADDSKVAEVDVSEPDSVDTKQLSQVSFKPDATYLLVGGVRGLGMSIATWAVTRGARDLVILSRSAGVDPDSKAFTRELESMGCSVSVVAGSVSSTDDVQRAVEAARFPIRGVFQLAMVLSDATVVDMTWSQWGEALRPKVEGTWNLHNALLGHELDVFWMASSVITAFEMPGQSNYQAACVFLQAFCQYRHSLGLPASVLDISAINDVGYVFMNPEAVRQIRGFGLMFDGEREFLDCVELSLASTSHSQQSDQSSTAEDSQKKESNGETEGKKENKKQGLPQSWVNYSHVTMGVKSEKHLDDPKCTTSWRRNPKMGFYHNDKPDVAGQEGDADNTLSELLRRVAEPQGKALLGEESTADALAHEIGVKIQDLMMRSQDEVDVSESLADIGLDSLMAIQLRRWFKSVVGVQLSVLEIMATPSLRQLGALTATKLLDHLHTSKGEA